MVLPHTPAPSSQEDCEPAKEGRVGVTFAPCALDVAGEEYIWLVFDWMSSLIYGIMMPSN
jgi:hypothetical protein